MKLLPIPYDTPVLIKTSNSGLDNRQYVSERYRGGWWCEVTWVPARNDSIAQVHAPGHPDHDFLTLSLPADDPDEAEGTAHQAIRVARELVAVVDRDDAACGDGLREVMAALGKRTDRFGGAWSEVLEWVPQARAALTFEDLPELHIGGAVPADTLWTVSMVAGFLGYSGDAATGSARKWLFRHGLQSEGREVGRWGESLYSEARVREAAEASPGKGRRGARREDGGRFATADSDA
ncbi:hypothetical protein [Streptomyces sp. NPDC007088]|uniref:hypothetical protein n=1 Tax=Streptomyces sp. NPDC007088 TaxID=3364773 RepID=UPI0036976077